METTATAQDVTNGISKFLKAEGVLWEKPRADEAPAMLGTNSGLQWKVKRKMSTIQGIALHATSIHARLRDFQVI